MSADRQTETQPKVDLDVQADIARMNARIARLERALKPFADAVYNDNGAMTITPCGIDEYARAYFVMRRTESASVK